MPSFDAIVLGGGHNGLVAAALLARAGRSTLLVEAAEMLGGAARTVEFAPGFRCSEVAQFLTHLSQDVVDTLDLEKHGLRTTTFDLATVALDRGGRPLSILGGSLSGDIADADRVAWRALRDKLLRFAGTLRPFLADVPPRLKPTDRASGLKLGQLGWRIRKLGRTDMREFLRLLLMNIADVLNEELEDDRLKGAVAFDAVLGTHLGPLSPGSMLSYYYRLAGAFGGRQGAVGLPLDGMGGAIHALESAATAAGATIRTGATVTGILVEQGAATGIRLASGEEVRAPLILSAANPRTTLLDLVGARHLDTDLVRRLRAIRMRGNAARLHLALDGLPEFLGLKASGLTERLVIAPSIRAVEAAFDPAKYGAFSPEPAMEIAIPTLFAGGALAPEGKHVLSATVQYAPYHLKEGWASGRPKLLEACLATLEAYAPGIRPLVRHAELLTPADIEARCRMPGGHWHHGELAVDQMFFLRPTQSLAQYRTPIGGLYLAGAGSHPGGNVMGLAAMNAVNLALDTEARR